MIEPISTAVRCFYKTDFFENTGSDDNTCNDRLPSPLYHWKFQIHVLPDRKYIPQAKHSPFAIASPRIFTFPSSFAIAVTQFIVISDCAEQVSGLGIQVKVENDFHN